VLFEAAVAVVVEEATVVLAVLAEVVAIRQRHTIQAPTHLIQKQTLVTQPVVTGAPQLPQAAVVGIEQVVRKCPAAWVIKIVYLVLTKKTLLQILMVGLVAVVGLTVMEVVGRAMV
tara:strand:+ start:516 stop:863 length:348 start_codon:yes stop_codon:yes gene_type:complete